MTALLHDPQALHEAIRAEINGRGRAAAVVFNSHITGLAVARSLGRRGVPVIALDRDPKGYALASKYVTVAALCPNVLADEEGFVRYLLDLGAVLDRPAVLYPTNDEWVLAVNRHRERLRALFHHPVLRPGDCRAGAGQGAALRDGARTRHPDPAHLGL